MPRLVFDNDAEEDRKVLYEEPKNKAVLDRKRKRHSEKKQNKADQEGIQQIVDRCSQLSQEETLTFSQFTDLPLSKRTLKGLKDAGFSTLTDVQRLSLGVSLAGKDVVGAAKTGSGKTLALLIPLLECLWKQRWTKVCGLGALVITPTRELAFQIFQVLNQIGAHHDFSAALLVGGNDVEFEKSRVGSMNIIVCTPGRLLQHMDENEQFNCDQLQMLVIDEADRILDMGFKQQMDAIVENLPKDRQTLLFSATQTRRVEDLVRVSLHSPQFVSAHEHSQKATPDQLEQNYVVLEEQEKIDMLWSFLTSHLRKKTLIFVTSCKQARFLTDALCHLRPGLSLMGLWGDMNQARRMDTFHKFDRSGTGGTAKGAAMIATDVASRGLDFKGIDWVLQLDCPSDVDDYIHRVGRTARMDNKGNALLVLTPSQEKGFVPMLQERHIPITRTYIRKDKIVGIRRKLANLMIPFPQLKEFAQGSFVSYAKAINFAKLKTVFDINTINFEELAGSYGLAVTPRIRFLRKQGIYVGGGAIPSSVEEGPSGSGNDSGEEEGENDFLKITKRDVFKGLEDVTATDEALARIAPKKVVTKTELAKKIIKRKATVNKKIRFDE